MYWYIALKTVPYQYLINYPDDMIFYNYDDPDEDSDSESFIDYPEESESESDF